MSDFNNGAIIQVAKLVWGEKGKEEELVLIKTIKTNIRREKSRDIELGGLSFDSLG